MAGRKRQLFEVLGARQGTTRGSAGSRRGKRGADADSGIDKVVGAGRSALAWFEQATSGSSSGRGSGRGGAGKSSPKPASPRKGASIRPAGPLPAPTSGFALLVVAFVLLGVGFGLGRWTASPVEAPDSAQLRRQAGSGSLDEGSGLGDSGPGGGPARPAWVERSAPLADDQLFERLEGGFYPVVVVPVDKIALARQVVEMLRAEGLPSARAQQITDRQGADVLAIGVFWPGDEGVLAERVRAVDAGGDPRLQRRIDSFEPWTCDLDG